MIIRSEHKSLVRSIIELLEVRYFFSFLKKLKSLKCSNAFQELIPYGCRKTNYYSDQYINSYECNLLGLSHKFDTNCISILDDFILIDFASNNDVILDSIQFTIKTNAKYPAQSKLYFYLNSNI